MKVYLMNLLVYLLFMMMNIISILISLAFLTLLERKLLGSIQLRKGPNKVGVLGLFQPFSDAIKLFFKESLFLIKFNKFIYLCMPGAMIFLMLIMWMSMNSIYSVMHLNLLILFMFSILGMGIYPVLFSGWSSSSMYSLLGSLRAVIQSISYEISFMLLVLMVMMMIDSFNLLVLFSYQKYFKFMYLFNLVMLMFFVSMLSELNRTPFDFAEGESELVSGFNIEYMGGGFALIFMSEYGMIMLMSFWFSLLFMCLNLYSIFLYIIMVTISYILIWIRGVFPRFRYDMMMYLIWKNYLPLVLMMYMYMYWIKMMIGFILMV